MLSLSPWPPVVCAGILLQGQAGVPFSFPTLFPPKQAHNLLSFHSGCLTAGTTRKPIRHSRRILGSSKKPQNCHRKRLNMFGFQH